jgi:hypothetical protein
MEITVRGLWTMVHGMGFGALSRKMKPTSDTLPLRELGGRSTCPADSPGAADTRLARIGQERRSSVG